MNDKNRNLVIGLLSLVAAAVMFAALSLAIGKWNLSSGHHLITVHFPIVQGIDNHSEVKLAGAPAGHVISVSLIPLDKQDLDPISKTYNFVEVTAQLDDDVEIHRDYRAVIRQDGLGIAPKYLLIIPGTDRLSPKLPDGIPLQGEETPDITDLTKQLSTTLAKVDALVDQTTPVLGTMKDLSDNVQGLAKKLNDGLGPLMDHSETLVADASKLLEDYDSAAERQKLSKLLTNLDVTTDNLKVVSSNSKALTQTLAERPWRLLFGGKTILPPPEQQVLEANHPILLPHDDVRIPLRIPVKHTTETPTPTPTPTPDRIR
jgi:ABC-type transporter Mla subunit MlaD